MLIRESIGHFVGITKGTSFGLGGSKRLGKDFKEWHLQSKIFMN